MAENNTPFVMPNTPETRPGFRDSDYVQSVILKMGTSYVHYLDVLCAANRRSRREIVEILILEAAQKLHNNPETRIDPP